MPQMAPIMWTPILLTMNMMIIMISTKLFFSTKKSKNLNELTTKKNLFKKKNWKW
uniref:ATP synthase F0 subunit 8 n=1 Tax=Magadhaideus sp. n. SX-2018 TaxID=2220057 RepID=A0A3S5XHP8_9HEMI|nr:ATP synthase F0 subunit 8 [Magadhaideus sp. n. SX-2018]